MRYSHSQIEKKWQSFWQKQNTFITDLNNFKLPKYYVLDMFPYPSGSGLHVGHIRGYLATDIITRMKRMQGFNVFHPMGFDSFGLPAEQYAMRTKKDPYIFTNKNIQNFIVQLKSLGFAYDYRNLLKTSNPEYYHWTQWTFLNFFQKNIAFLKDTMVNYCPKLNTVLANEEIISKNGQMLSERGEYPVFLHPQKQWAMNITHYADDLIQGLKNLDWPDSIKQAQIKWIGKTKGFTIQLFLFEHKHISFSLFVEELVSLSKATFLIFSVNNKIFDQLLSTEISTKLTKLRTFLTQKPITDRRKINFSPLGLFSGFSVINPVNSLKIPIYYGEYVDNDFAFQNQVGNPSFSRQDWFFAKKHNITPLPDKNSYQNTEKIFKSSNHLMETKLIRNKLKKMNILKKNEFYKIKDWIFSRQRYWGEPFPIFYKNNKPFPLDEKDLPLKLPKFNLNLWSKKNNLKSTTPLSRVPEWRKKHLETSTMPQWAGSCWYFLGYLLKKENDFWPLNSPQAKKLFHHWLPIDLYIGGQEHAVSHLLYARFWNLFLFNLGITNHKEPFYKLRNQGIILSNSGKKMSKSKNNTVNPLDFLVSHGADAIRLHEKFLGPFSEPIRWNDENLDAMRKWLARVYVLFLKKDKFWQNNSPNEEQKHLCAKLIHDVTRNYERYFFNVAISQLMSFINLCYKSKLMPRKLGTVFIQLLHPVCPHITEEIAEKWNMPFSLVNSKWPTYDSKDLILKTIHIALQINGKLRGLLKTNLNSEKEETIANAKIKLSDYLINVKVKNIIFVQNKIVNFVVE